MRSSQLCELDGKTNNSVHQHEILQNLSKFGFNYSNETFR